MKKLRNMSDKTIVLIARWWFAGAVYFFIGFGTPFGNTSSAIDLIFFLGIGIGFGNIFIFYPIVYNMFTIERRGTIYNGTYLKMSLQKRVLTSLTEIIRCLCTVIVVFFTYQAINLFLVYITSKPEGTVLLPGEPIIFAIFFVFYYLITDKIVDKMHNIYKLFIKKKEKTHE